MNKQETKLIKKIYSLTCFPSFKLYEYDGTETMMPMNHGCFARGFMSSLLYNPWLSLEEMIERDVQWAYSGRYEYEHWENQHKIVEDGYYEQFNKWWSIDENKKSILCNSELVDLYTKVTNKRKLLKRYKKEVSKNDN